jgi:hypothetical protein
MALNIQGVRDFFDGAWKEISSWGAGMDFSFYDHLQDRIEQLEQDLDRAKQPQGEISTGPLGMQHLEPCR